MRIAGIILVIIGVLVLVFQGVSYTDREKVLDIGPLEAHTEKEKTIPLPPVLGGIAIVAGVGLLVMGNRKP